MLGILMVVGYFTFQKITTRFEPEPEKVVDDQPDALEEDLHAVYVEDRIKILNTPQIFETKCLESTIKIIEKKIPFARSGVDYGIAKEYIASYFDKETGEIRGGVPVSVYNQGGKPLQDAGTSCQVEIINFEDVYYSAYVRARFKNKNLKF